MDLFEDVRQFHQKFGIDTHPATPPRLLEPDVQLFRLGFLYEELSEFHRAWSNHDLAEAADALVDLAVVCLGTAHMMGVPFNDCWKLVHAANMAKERATSANDPRSKRKHAADIVKPEGWLAPDLKPLLILP